MTSGFESRGPLVGENSCGGQHAHEVHCAPLRTVQCAPCSCSAHPRQFPQPWTSVSQQQWERTYPRCAGEIARHGARTHLAGFTHLIATISFRHMFVMLCIVDPDACRISSTQTRCNHFVQRESTPSAARLSRDTTSCWSSLDLVRHRFARHKHKEANQLFTLPQCVSWAALRLPSVTLRSTACFICLTQKCKTAKKTQSSLCAQGNTSRR